MISVSLVTTPHEYSLGMVDAAVKVNKDFRSSMHLILSNCAVANRKLSLLEYLVQHSVNFQRASVAH